MNKYSCEGINYPLKKNRLKKVQKNNLTIAVYVLRAKETEYMKYSKHNSKRRNKLFFQIILI